MYRQYFSSMLEYMVDKVKHGDYSSWTVSRKKPISEFADYILANDVLGTITTVVHNPWFGRKLHILALDCDSPDQMLAAMNWHKTQHGFEGIAIASSDERFWVIFDVILPWPEIRRHLTTTPGVDENFIKLCRGRRRIHLRAIPKVADSGICTPRFMDWHPKNPLIKQWYDEFRAHFDSPEYARLKKGFALRKAIKDNRMMELVADPGFAV